MEIKRTVLPPYGGPREDSGANGSLWSMGGKIIGSSGAEDNRVAVPMLIGLTASQALEALESVGLIPGPSTTTFGATEGNDGTVAAQAELANTLVNVGAIVSYAIFEYTAPPAALVGPTTNWLTAFGGKFILPSTIYPEPETEWADIVANPIAYSLVIEGGPLAGTYPISEALQFGPTAPGIVALSVDTLEFDFPDRLIGLEGAEMSYWVGNGWAPTAGTASIVLS